MGIIFHEAVHLAMFVVGGAACYSIWRSYSSLFAFFFGSLLIDVDHLFDYIRYAGVNFRFDWIITGIYFELNRKVIVPLHSFELALILFLFGHFSSKRKHVWYPLAAAIVLHLLWDQITYTPNIFAYSLVYRLLHSFSISAFQN